MVLNSLYLQTCRDFYNLSNECCCSKTNPLGDIQFIPTLLLQLRKIFLSFLESSLFMDVVKDCHIFAISRWIMIFQSYLEKSVYP